MTLSAGLRSFTRSEAARLQNSDVISPPGGSHTDCHCNPVSASPARWLVCRYEKYVADKPERLEKSNDPFLDEFQSLVTRVNELTLVSSRGIEG